MANLSSRISLQETRFSLIQQASETVVEDQPTTLNQKLIATRLNVLETNWSKFQLDHDDLCRHDFERLQHLPYIRGKVYERCQEFYVQARVMLLVQQESVANSSTSAHSSGNVTPHVVSHSYRTALPRIQLPRFSGDYQAWRSFADLFSSMIVNNSELNSVEKMHYLKSSLSGEAFRLISNVPVSHDTFASAWQTLQARFENKRFLISSHLDKLLNLKRLKTNNASELRSFLTTVTECIGALRTLDCQTHHWDPILLHMLVRLLDPTTREAWEVRLGSTTSYPTFAQFEEFLTCRTRAMESMSLSQPDRDRPARTSRPDHKVKVFAATSADSIERQSCPLCRDNNRLSGCSKYQSRTVLQRRDLVNTRKLCFNCLGKHPAKHCPSIRRCWKCGQRHHTSLHQDASARPPGPPTRSSATLITEERADPSSVSPSAGPVLLATSQANIINDGRKESVRFLIDQGSELSFITEALVNRLRLPRRAASIPLLGIGGVYSGRTRGIVSLSLQSMYDATHGCTIAAYILPCLTRQLPSFPIASGSWPNLERLQLADPDYGRPGSIHLLLGSDSYGQIILPDLVRGEPGGPIAQLTIFGWVLSGPIQSADDTTTVPGYHCLVDRDLINLLQRFWTQEEPPQATEKSLSPEDAYCEDHFKETHLRDHTGRYIVRLPLKAPVSSLGSSELAARQSLARLRRRFEANPAYEERYSDFIREYQALGHLVVVPTSEIESSSAYYLPHHGVLREQNQTTKLRVVFNGSSRTSNGTSLNDILHTGPKLQTEISDVLLWARLHRFIFATDITKMYHQIKVHRDDWDLQRILWHDQGHLIPCRLTTVTYGINCAPYLALRTVQQLIDDEGHRFPLAIPALTKGRYVDDIFGGAESIQEAQMIIDQLIQIMTAGGFPLQKWTSNCSDLLKTIPDISHDTPSSRELEPSRVKILGLVWQPLTDSFTFTSWPSPKPIITKRSVLSEIAQLFDP